jgi:hypothetical protein
VPDRQEISTNAVLRISGGVAGVAVVNSMLRRLVLAAFAVTATSAIVGSGCTMSDRRHGHGPLDGLRAVRWGSGSWVRFVARQAPLTCPSPTQHTIAVRQDRTAEKTDALTAP